MKSLQKMCNVDKIHLLAMLFPDYITGIAQFIQAQCKFIDDNREEVKANWDTNFVAFEWWYSLSIQVDESLNENRLKLSAHPLKFANIIGDHYKAIYSIDCIVKYANSLEKSQRFKDAVNLLFNFYPDW